VTKRLIRREFSSAAGFQVKISGISAPLFDGIIRQSSLGFHMASLRLTLKHFHFFSGQLYLPI
jgi:hypothetical protein